MKVLKDADLRGFSTMRLTAVGETVYEPESAEELGRVLHELRGRKFHLLGAGSNVVFAERVKTPVVSLMKVDGSIEDLGGGHFRAGCSVRIQRLIRFAQQRGFGGIEYLFSLPASLGGCVFMNAGRDRRIGDAIATVLEEVEWMDLDSGKIRREPVDRSAFGHRTSPYQTRRCAILGATLRLRPQPPEETERRIRERLEASRKHLDAGLPSCGTVFHRGNRVIFRLFRLFHPKAGGLAFSAKTSDWIGNRGGGTLSDFKRLAGKMEKAHRLLGQSCELEIRIFE